MNLKDAEKIFNTGEGRKLYIPSLKRELLFKPVNTGIQKTLGRCLLDFNSYDSSMVRLSLFSKLLLEETRENHTVNLKLVDIIAFYAQLKMQMVKFLEASIPCHKCGKENKIKIDLEKVLDNCASYEFKEFSVEIKDGKNTYLFTISDPSYYDDLILSEGVRRSKDVTAEEEGESELYYLYSKICLYVKKMRLNGEEIKGNNEEDFHLIPIHDRLKFFDAIDQKITIDEDNPDSLLSKIFDNFDDEKASSKIFDSAIDLSECTFCHEPTAGSVNFLNFFGF